MGNGIKTVLFVGNESSELEIINQSFNNFLDQYKLVFACSLAEAREYLKKSSPDILFTDSTLPDGKGFELKNSNGHDYPVSVIINNGDEKYISESLNIGGLEYLIQSDEILTCLPHIAETAIREWNIEKLYKEAEIALQRSEDKYRHIVENSNELIFRSDSKGNFTYMNRPGLRKVGYALGELCQMSYMDLIPDDYKNRVFEFYKKQLVEEIEQSYLEFPVLAKNGSTVWIGQSVKSIKDRNGNVEFLCIAKDITEKMIAEEALHESEEKYKTILENIEEGYWETDLKGNITFMNRATCEILGRSEDELMGMNYRSYISGKSLDEVHKIFEMLLESKMRVILAEWSIVRKDGEERYVQSSIDLLTGNSCEIIGFKTVTRDITQKKLVEKALQESERRHRMLYNNALVAMLTIDYNTGKILLSNDLGYKIFGYESKSEFLINVNIVDRYAQPNARGNLIRHLKKNGEIFNREVQFKRKDGEVFWAEITAKQFIDEGTVECIVIDITKKKEVEKQVYRLTFYDSLTELPNKDMFINRVQMEVVKAKRFAVMCIGMDKFKVINDMYGQKIGDRLLQDIALELSGVYFDKDMIARYEGDKFMILLSNIGSIGDDMNIEDINKIVQKTHNLFAKPFNVDGNCIDVTSSIGLCLFPNDGSNAEELTRKCESAMYIAKERGRNVSCFFDAILNEKMMNRLKLERELRSAIANNEFIAYYQPKVDSEGRIHGMESLIRWQPPDRGIVPPVMFIPLAEQNGMIEEIGYKILHTSCEQNKGWQDMGYNPVRVAVNLSPYQFSQTDLIDNIEKILHQTGLDPKWLELEITESGIMKNEKESIDKIQRLHDIGFSIAIDDFGTGYSSLSKLQDYPVDTLKIDRSFISNILTNEKTAAISKYIINLAHDLGFMVVAEGIEKVDQLNFLIDNNCDLFQGYYFSKPLPADEFEKKSLVKQKLI